MKEMIEQLSIGVRRIERLVRRMDDAANFEQIEVDLLLQELRTMYGVVLGLSDGQDDTQAVPPEASPSTEATTPAIEEVADEPMEESAEKPMEEPSFDEKADENPQPEPQTVVEATAAAVAPMTDIEEVDPEVPAQPLMQAMEDDSTGTLFDETAAPIETIEPEPIETTEDAKPAETISPIEPIQPIEPTQPIAPTQPTETEQRNEEVKVEAPQRQSSLFDYIRPTEHATESGAETLGDKLGRAGNEMRGESAQHKKVADLRTIININDKFSFMKDLFQNNMKAYNDFIVELNGIDDRATAQRRVDEMAQLYHWDKSSLTTKTFYNIFDRKF